MGANDCQCLVCRVVRVATGSDVYLGHMNRQALDQVAELLGTVPRYTSGTSDYPNGWMTIDVIREGRRFFAQAHATEEERLANPALVEEMSL